MLSSSTYLLTYLLVLNEQRGGCYLLGFGFSSPQKGNNRVARERPRPPPRGSVLRERHAVALRGRIERGRCPARRCRCGLTHLHKRDRCRNEHDDCRNERDYGCPASRSKRQTPAALVGAAGGEAQRAAQGTELVRFAQHTHASLPRSLWATKHSSTLCHAPRTGCNSIACRSRLQEKEGERTRTFRPWLRNRSASRWRPPTAPAKPACCDRCAT